MKTVKDVLIKITGIIFLFSLLTACDKQPEQEVSKSKAELISSGNWYFTAYTETHNGTTTDVLAGMLTCHKDNYYVFRADGSGEFNYGVQKCANDPQSLPYTWTFIDNETKVKLDNGNIYIINLLTQDKLELVFGTPGANYNTLTFSH
jgi:hypothetical protein